MSESNVEFDILVSKIEKMWRRANHPNTPPAEAEIAKTKALAYMEQHRIEMAMLSLAEDDVLGDHDYGRVTGTYGRIQLDFLDTVARAFDSRVWWTNYGTNYTVRVTGYASDFRRIKALVTFLLADAMAQAGKFKSRSMAITKDYRRTFVQSYSYEIGRRLREAKAVAREDEVARIAADDVIHGRNSLDAVEHAERAVTGAEVVLAEKKQRVADFMKTKKLRNAGRSRGGGSQRGAADGRIAGQNADLSGGRNRMGGGNKAIGR